MRFFYTNPKSIFSSYLQWLLVVLCISLFNSCVTDHSSHSHGQPHNHDHSHNNKEDLVPHPEIDSLYLFVPRNGKPVDFHTPLKNPIWQDGIGGAHMKDDDTVIGIVVKEQAYALPWWVLKNHHIANLTLENQPVFVGLCEMCGSGIAYKAEIGDKRLHFLQHGLYKSSWFMKDEETGSFWLPFEGKSFYGTLKDSVLTHIDTYQMNWKDWIESFPTTKVLYASQSKRKGHGSKDYLGREHIEDIFSMTLPTSISTALPKFDIVLGVGSDGIYKAYSMTDLDKAGKVLEDTLPDGSPVVVLHKPNTTMSGAFVPSADGKSLSFTTNDNGDIIDTQTGSLWNYFGKCEEGKLKGHQLKSYFFIVKEWYGWYGYHPSTDVYKGK